MSEGPRPDDSKQDLGFGSVVTRAASLRLLNRDGSFNVQRKGLGLLSAMSPYHALVTMSWLRFNGIVLFSYLAANMLFALGYLACGPQALAAPPDAGLGVFRAFFFSVQTIATLGFGHIHPVGWAANTLVTLEALVGMLGFAVVTGLAFARFSRPTARLRFSLRAVIAPYRGGRALMFRLANLRRAELINLEAQVLFTWMGPEGRRSFDALPLERERVTFFPLVWTVVHPIGPDSPLAHATEESLRESDAELLVLLSAYDETFAQDVHARTSYRAEEMVVGARFRSILRRADSAAPVEADVADLDAIEAAELPAG